MTVRLQTPFAGQNISTLYTGAAETALVAAGTASLLATTGAGVGPAAAIPSVRLTTPYAGQGVGTIYNGSDRASVVARGLGYFEGTVGAGDYGIPLLALLSPIDLRVLLSPIDGRILLRAA